MARDYRNRRIGDFLKELELTEGRGTGFPTIYRAMSNNGSPDPVFDTDDQSTYFLTVLPVRSEESDQANDQVNELKFSDIKDVMSFLSKKSDQANDQARDQVQTIIQRDLHDKVTHILTITKDWVSRKEIFDQLDLSNHTTNRQKYLDPLIAIGWVQLKYPETRRHPDQQYKISDTGKRFLAFMAGG